VHLVLLHVDSEHGWLSSLVTASTLGRWWHDGPRHQVDVVHLLVDVAHRRTKSYHTLPHLTVSLPQFIDSPAADDDCEGDCNKKEEKQDRRGGKQDGEEFSSVRPRALSFFR